MQKQRAHRAPSLSPELTLSWDAHRSFSLPQDPAANVWNEEEVGVGSEQQNKHDLNSFSPLTQAAQARNFTCQREKSKIH